MTTLQVVLQYNAQPEGNYALQKGPEEIARFAACEIESRKEEVAVVRIPIIKLTRRQLYDEIWEISVAGAAKKYGVPYALLMKQVKEAGIPIPPSGYWAKLSFGKPVVKLELSEPFEEVVSIFDTMERIRERKPRKMPEPKLVIDPMPKNHKSRESSKSALQTEVAPSASIQDETIADAAIASITHVAPDPETIDLFGKPYNVYNRETLYQEVWEAPVTQVAKRYEVSDVAIHKVCKALEIPTPPAGYWAKVRAGKAVTVIPLPKSDTASEKIGIRTGMTYQQEAAREPLAFLTEEDRSVVLTVASQILLPDADARMHPKIIAHRKTVTEWKKQRKSAGSKGWTLHSSDSAPFLAEVISNDALPRVCRIIDALIKAMEPLGCSLTDDLGFIVTGETVRVSFSESKDKVAHMLTKEENMRLLEYEDARRRSSWASKPQIRKYDHVYNGRISLTVDGKKTFRDCKAYVLEERLGNIMIKIYEAAESLRQARVAREEAKRKRLEEEHRIEEHRKLYNTEVDRTRALANLAKDYATACEIRRYISVVEASESLSDETLGWIEWAKAKADWYDPTVAKEDALFGKREHQKDAEKKKLQHMGYWE